MPCQGVIPSSLRTAGLVNAVAGVCVGTASALTLILGLNYWEAPINPIVAEAAPAFVENHGAGESIGWVAVQLAQPAQPAQPG